MKLVAQNQPTPPPIQQAVVLDAVQGPPCCEYAPDRTQDMPAFIRHLKGSHPELTDELVASTNILADAVRKRWQQTFGGPLTVDFVCHNPAKMSLLMATMELSDIVPMVFGMGADKDNGRDHFRVVIEI